MNSRSLRIYILEQYKNLIDYLRLMTFFIFFVVCNKCRLSLLKVKKFPYNYSLKLKKPGTLCSIYRVFALAIEEH